jgi:tripartite-type tricarboxylate transporter receptor subunit TctC
MQGRGEVARALTLAVAIVAGCGPALADPVQDFYRGKTISLVVSTPPGGGYDLWGRLLSRHLGRHIPGNPGVIVQHMVGAGGIRATTTLYNVSPRDGTVIGVIHSTAPFVPLLDPGAPKFDASRFGWIGSMTKESSFCVVWGGAPVKTFANALSKRVIVGSTGPGSHMEVYPLLMNRLFGAKFEVISGYAGGNDIYLAMERGEVEGRCGITIVALRSVRPEWLSGKKANLIIQTALEADPDEAARGVPMLIDLAKTDEQRRIMELLFANGEIQIPVLAPPDVPAERLAALRTALKAALNDPAMLEDARKQSFVLRHVPGEEVERLIKRVYATPASIVEAAIAATRSAGSR